MAAHLTLRAPTEFDLSTCSRMDVQATAIGPGSHVVVDMRHTTFIDSTAAGWLLRLHRRSVRLGGTVTVQPSPQVQRVLELTGIDRVVDVVDR